MRAAKLAAERAKKRAEYLAVGDRAARWAAMQSQPAHTNAPPATVLPKPPTPAESAPAPATQLRPPEPHAVDVRKLAKELGCSARILRAVFAQCGIEPAQDLIPFTHTTETGFWVRAHAARAARAFCQQISPASTKFFTSDASLVVRHKLQNASHIDEFVASQPTNQALQARRLLRTSGGVTTWHYNQNAVHIIEAELVPNAPKVGRG